MKRDDGFTLIEVLITTVILGLIIGAIASATIVGLKTTDETAQRLNETRDEHLTSANVVPDIQSADDVSLTDTACSGVTPVVRLSWSDQGVAKIASYYVATSGTERQLLRAYCENAVLLKTSVISHFLEDDPVGGTNPTVTCVPAASCPGRPTSVKMSVSACVRNALGVCPAPGVANTTTYSYVVGAALRDAA